MSMCVTNRQVKGSHPSFPLTLKIWCLFNDGLTWVGVPGLLGNGG
jgi:hypothetical protein